mmetsp:Transcript_45810/g.115338  ORF Transcript_45810/g.115338 Transcript_45810/m.115338 type:complete len:270 (+) Transcript_45810:616-1425(+)
MIAMIRRVDKVGVVELLVALEDLEQIADDIVHRDQRLKTATIQCVVHGLDRCVHRIGGTNHPVFVGLMYVVGGISRRQNIGEQMLVARCAGRRTMWGWRVHMHKERNIHGDSLLQPRVGPMPNHVRKVVCRLIRVVTPYTVVRHRVVVVDAVAEQCKPIGPARRHMRVVRVLVLVFARVEGAIAGSLQSSGHGAILVSVQVRVAVGNGVVDHSGVVDVAPGEDGGTTRTADRRRAEGIRVAASRVADQSSQRGLRAQRVQQEVLIVGHQ